MSEDWFVSEHHVTVRLIIQCEYKSCSHDTCQTNVCRCACLVPASDLTFSSSFTHCFFLNHSFRYLCHIPYLFFMCVSPLLSVSAQTSSFHSSFDCFFLPSLFLPVLMYSFFSALTLISSLLPPPSFHFLSVFPATFSSPILTFIAVVFLPVSCLVSPYSIFFYSCHHPPPSMQQRSHQYEGTACEWQRSGGALGSSGGYLPPTHPPLPGVIQLDVARWQLWGNASHWCQTQTGRDWAYTDIYFLIRPGLKALTNWQYVIVIKPKWYFSWKVEEWYFFPLKLPELHYFSDVTMMCQCKKWNQHPHREGMTTQTFGESFT